LYEQALRVNGKNELLHHEYFKFELLNLFKIESRRSVLGLDAAKEVNASVFLSAFFFFYAESTSNIVFFL